ncbi:MAG: hypothetical protein IK078_09285, partial [Lachnospiraceae bacterium]|nr:hypothetical protein [Lachnospiraceae bacterium]
MNGNKIINGILEDLRQLPRNALKPYRKNGKINANKIAMDLIPFLVLFYFTNKYLQAVLASTKEDVLDKCVEAFSLIFQVPPLVAPALGIVPVMGGVIAGASFKLYMGARKKMPNSFGMVRNTAQPNGGQIKILNPTPMTTG